MLPDDDHHIYSNEEDQMFSEEEFELHYILILLYVIQ